MENLQIENTNYTPQIDLNAQTGVFNIKGKSYPENTFEVYKPVQEWIENYFKNTENEKTTINLELLYLNSSSLKAYFDMFDIFESAHEDGKNIEINWIYESDDDIIEETGEDFKDDFEDLTINLITK
jgi:hypothetical protein